MHNPFKKEPTIEFFSLMPDVVKIAPIQSAANFRPELMTNAAKDLSRKKREPEYGFTKLNNTAKCPGIYHYANHGWVMTTFQDIIIRTNGDGETISTDSAINNTMMKGGEYIGSTISFHPPQQYANYMGNMANTVRNVIKIHTPWRCVVPEGYYLQEGHLPYSNEKRFTTATGFFSRDYGVAQMNVQLLWHVMDGEVILKAGTPIAHYMLIPKKQHKLEVRSATEQDLEYERITHAEINRKFVSNRTESKCIYAKLFGK
jgi:hypothetical protein